MIVSAGGTHPGNKRELNEDCFEANDELGLWLVADGVGGHAKGEVASEIVRSTLVASVAAGKGLVEAIQEAHGEVLRTADQLSDASGMASTVVAARIEANEYEVAWIGDSRAYLFNTALQQVSTDHSYVQMLLDNCLISEEEAKDHPDKNIITQSIGEPDLKQLDVGVFKGSLGAGDILLLCSDGLSDEICDADIAAQLQTPALLEEKVDTLIAAALEAGGRDNCTVVLIKNETAVDQVADVTAEAKVGDSPEEPVNRRLWPGLIIAVAILLLLYVFYSIS